MPFDGSSLLAELPKFFRQTPYVYERYPGAPGVDGIRGGANCQLFAYSVLAHFGRAAPPLRSSNLWGDQTSTTRVPNDYLKPLDLLLFNRTADPFGAHVAVYIADDQILHLSKEVGIPAVWTFADFAQRDNCAVLVGAKRATAQMSPVTTTSRPNTAAV